MKVLIDCRCLQSPPPRGGVGVYAEQLVRALVDGNQGSRMKNHGIEWILFANGLIDPRRHLPQFDAPTVRWVVGHLPNKLLNLRSLVPHPSSLIPHADVIFLPNLNFLPPIPKHTRLVVTVHDLSFEHFPECFTWKQRLWHHFVRPRKLLQRANAIIAVSETTKQDIVETYGIDAGKVHVVYPGIEQGTGDKEQGTEREVRRRYRLPERFVLSLADLSPRKNIDGLIAAFEQLPATSDKRQALSLIVAGKSGHAERAIRRQIARSPACDRIHLIGPVSENEKRALLARTSCFVYPSLWEGFGFPPLEAMAAGVPVVASTGGALPEVLGDAALLVDPLDPTAIADAISRVLSDDTLRKNLISRGRSRAAQYRWDDAANRLRAILTNSSGAP